MNVQSKNGRGWAYVLFQILNKGTNIYKVINLLHYYLTNLIRDNIVRRKINDIGESKWI